MFMEVGATSIAVAALLYFIAVLSALNIRRTADAIYRWYHSIPEGKWGPNWLRWQFRPTMKQATLIVYGSIAFCVAFPTVYLVIRLL